MAREVYIGAQLADEWGNEHTVVLFTWCGRDNVVGNCISGCVRCDDCTPLDKILKQEIRRRISDTIVEVQRQIDSLRDILHYSGNLTSEYVAAIVDTIYEDECSIKQLQAADIILANLEDNAALVVGVSD